MSLNGIICKLFRLHQSGSAVPLDCATTHLQTSFTLAPAHQYTMASTHYLSFLACYQSLCWPITPDLQLADLLLLTGQPTDPHMPSIHSSAALKWLITLFISGGKISPKAQTTKVLHFFILNLEGHEFLFLFFARWGNHVASKLHLQHVGSLFLFSLLRHHQYVIIHKTKIFNLSLKPSQKNI